MANKPSIVIQGVRSIDEVPGLESIADQATFRCVSSTRALCEALPGAEIMLGWNFSADDLRQGFSYADSLRWIQWAGAGVDAALFPELVASEVLLTNMRGVFDRPMAEYTLAMILAFGKDLRRTIEAQRAHEWDYRLTDSLEGRRVLIVGVGSIGRAVARLLNAAGFEVSGVGRSARAHDADFGQITASSELIAQLPGADFVVLVAPLTEQTRGMFGQHELNTMKPSSYLINIGRGALVDERALIDALRRGAIAGAGLDVFEVEPLPEGSPLWDMPNVLVSPHMSGDTHGFKAAMAAVFLDNFRRYQSGNPLSNLVDKQAGFVPSGT